MVVQVSGGKSMKTGFALARAKLSESSSGMSAVRDRQASLPSARARPRRPHVAAEKVAHQAPGRLGEEPLAGRTKWLRGYAKAQGREESEGFFYMFTEKHMFTRAFYWRVQKLSESYPARVYSPHDRRTLSEVSNYVVQSGALGGSLRHPRVADAAACAEHW